MLLQGHVVVFGKRRESTDCVVRAEVHFLRVLRPSGTARTRWVPSGSRVVALEGAVH